MVCFHPDRNASHCHTVGRGPLPPQTAPTSDESRYEDFLRGIGSDRVLRNHSLAPHTTFGIGGEADLFVEAQTVEEFTEVVREARAHKVPFFVLGRGANILVSDKGYRGLVIRCAIGGIEFLGEHRVRVGAGIDTFPDLINATVAQGLGGLHHFVGIPSTVGGAMWQNLHFLSPAPDRERTVFFEEFVESARILCRDGSIKEVGVDYFEFGYDTSILHFKDDLVLDVTLRLIPTPQEDLRQVMMENLQWRDERHPDLWLYPCAGSIFKKIEGIGAGRLIDQCGLKGHRLGGAQIFHKHANIIVNVGGATSAEVQSLIVLAQETVERETGHRLEAEISLIGEF